MKIDQTTYKITPGKLFSGNIRIPASKSYGQRALVCALINPNKTFVYGLGSSDDELAVLTLIQDLGARITTYQDHIEIQGIDFEKSNSNQVSMGESGLATRMLTPILALFSDKIEIHGHGSLLNRSMEFFDRYLPELNVQFTSNQHKVPFQVKGPLKPKSISVDASASSQYITGLIYAFVASRINESITLTLENPTSIPYIELSLEVLQEMNIHLSLKNNQIDFNQPISFSPSTLQVEGDWSSASYFLVAAAIQGKIKLENLRKSSRQADRKLVEVLLDFGANVSQTETEITVESKEHHAFVFDATHCPDLFPALAVLAVFGDSVSKIKGVSRLFNKESNRGLSIQTEFNKMGIQVDIQDDWMFVYPKKELIGATFHSHRDHRIAMACSVLAHFAHGESSIVNSGVVSKSYPDFFSDFQKLQKK